MLNFLILLGHATLENLQKDTTPEHVEAYRSTLILCLMRLHLQGFSCYISHVAYWVLRNRTKEQDKNLLLTYVKEDPNEDQDQVIQHTQSAWVMPIINVNDGPKTAILNNVLKEYQKLSLDSASDFSLSPA